MPSWPDLHRSRGPRADPLTYPGELVQASYLWMDRWCYPLAVPGLGSGDWLVQPDGGPLGAAGAPAVGLTTGSAPRFTGLVSNAVWRLDDALLFAGAAPVVDRRPVIAFGSNAAPAQLRDKFQPLAPDERVVPVLRGSVRGFVLGHSPHVSDPGYLPFVLVGNGLDFQMGRSLKYRKTPHNRLLLSLAHGFGHTIPRFGNSDYCGEGPLSLS